LAEIVNETFDLNVVDSTIGKHPKRIGLSHQEAVVPFKREPTPPLGGALSRSKQVAR